MSITDTILCRDARSESKRTGRPVVEKLTPNMVYVIISPNGAMNNIVGIENVEKFITNYIERHKDD